MRDTYVDIAKGICILLVICIHSEVFGVIGMPLMFIAVPMFFFMSGFYDRPNLPLQSFVSKNVRALILPAIIWCIISGIYLFLLKYIKGEMEPFSMDIYNPCMTNGPTWFIVALFYTKSFVYLLEKVKLPEYVSLVISLCLGYVGSTYEMPLLIDEGLAAFPLYYIGKMLYHKMNLFSKNLYVVGLGVISMILFIMGYISYGIVPLRNGCYMPYYLVAIIAITMVFSPVLYVSRIIEDASLLQKIGQRSLGIMLIHSPICHTFAVILNRMFERGSVMWISSFLFCYLLTAFISYILTVYIEKYCPILMGKHK